MLIPMNLYNNTQVALLKQIGFWSTNTSKIVYCVVGYSNLGVYLVGGPDGKKYILHFFNFKFQPKNKGPVL